MSKCKEEPCKSALDAYNMLILDGMDIESKISKDCGDRRDFILIGRWLFALWATIAGQALLCLLLHFGMLPLCDWLFVLAAAVLVMLWLLFFAVIALTLRLARLRKQCQDINKRLRDAFAVIKRDCPEECWPKELTQFKCNC